MNVLNIFEIELFAFLLILARMASFLVTWPVFGGMNVPAPVKILLSITMSLVLFPLLKGSFHAPMESWQQLMLMVGREVVVGLVMAQVSYFFFYAVQAGGELVSISLGYASASVFNPALGAQSTVVDTFYYTIAALFFLMINGHHMFLTGLVQSYDMIPVGEWALNVKSMAEVALIAKEVMVLGLQLAAPILVSILLINISLAIVGRAVPQINVLITSLPVNILIGVTIVIVSMPFLLSQFGDSLESFMTHFFGLLKTI